jgi:hypothetical protein
MIDAGQDGKMEILANLIVEENTMKKPNASLQGAIFMMMVLSPVSLAAATSYSFNLIGPNTASAASSGNTIRVTGSGTFDTVAKTVDASGSFTIKLADGTVVSKGTWEATAFTSFISFGGLTNGSGRLISGEQGGELALIVTLFPDGGAPVTGVVMTVTCALGTFPPGTEEGTTVGAFLEKTGGSTLFHQ